MINFVEFNNEITDEFISIDFETANSKRESACQIALIHFKGEKIKDEKSWLIKPPKEYNFFSNLNIQIHKIHPEDVQNAPEFNELWDEIRPLIEDKIIIAHNAPFDISVLRSLINYYGLQCSKVNFICTYNVARKTWNNQINYTLKNIANQLGYIFNHHDAHDDAKICGKILIQALKFHNCKTIKELTEKIDMQIGHFDKNEYITCSITDGYKGIGRKNNYVKVTDIKPSIDYMTNQNNIFCNKNVCITGTLISMTRLFALQKIVDIGGIASNSVNKNTNFLIMGIQDFSLFVDGKESIKTKKAKELIKSGYNLQIINEDDFLKMLYQGENQ